MIRVITVFYALIIFGIVVCASNGWFPNAFELVQNYLSDKALHFLLVGVLALLLNLSLNLASMSSRIIWLQWGTVSLLALATVEEFSQLWFANRTFDLLDLSCNYLGIVVLGSLALLFRRTEQRIT